MAVDFGLLNQTPLSLKAAMPPEIDVVGNQSRAYTLAGQKLGYEQKAQQAQDTNADREVLKAAMQDPDFDLYTPEGAERTLQKLKGKVSPDTFMSLSDHAQKVKIQDSNLRKSLLGMKDAELDLTARRFETLVPGFKQLDDQYKKDVAEKGQQAAEQLFIENRNKLGQQMQSAGLIDEQTAKMLPTITPQTVGAAWRGSSHGKNIVDSYVKEAQARRQDALAESLKNPTGWEMYNTPDGRQFKYNQKSGVTVTLDDAGQWVETPSVPPGAIRVNAQKPVAGAAGGAVVDFEKQPPTESETAEAKKYILTGKMPQVGTGGQAAAKRLRILELATQEAEKMGMSPEQVVQLQNKVKSAQEGTKRLMTQSAQIRAGEENVQGVLNVLEDEVRKLGGIDSPKVKGWLNRAYTEWKGDPDFIGVNQAYLDLIENTARVYSGVTGAGGTPVSFLELAKKSLPENPSLAQVLKLRETLPKLFKARREATEHEMDAISKTASLPEPKTKEPTGKDDSDRVSIMMREYNDAIARTKTAKGDELVRARDDARSIRKELKALGKDVPDIGEPVKESAPAGGPKDGDKSKSKSGKDIIFRNGKWEYL